MVSFLALLFGVRLGHPWMGLAVFVLLFVSALIVPKLARRKLELFDKQAMKLLAAGKAAQVEELAKANLLLAMLGPRGCMDGKLGLAMLETGRYAQAVWRLSSGLESTQGPGALPLRIGLCKAYLLTNEPLRAEALAADIDRIGLSLPEVLAVRAVAGLVLGKHELAEQYSRQARTLSHSRDVALMLDLLDIELGLARGAQVELPSEADSAQPFLAAWIHLVRGKLRQARGKEAEARTSYRKALELDKVGFVGASARHLLDLASSEGGTKGPAQRDPAVERKKKRR